MHHHPKNQERALNLSILILSGKANNWDKQIFDSIFLPLPTPEAENPTSRGFLRRLNGTERSSEAAGK
jgi:hypothetical protein